MSNLRNLAVSLMLLSTTLAAHGQPLTQDPKSCTIADISGGDSTKAIFPDGPSMYAALTGNWAGCDTNGKPVTFSFNQGRASGTVNSHTNYYATYTNCTWQGTKSYFFIDKGQLDLNIGAISCAEGSGKDSAHGDVGTVYAYGGKNKVDFLVLELKFQKYAVVRKVR